MTIARVRKNNIIGDNIGYVELIEWMGGDDRIVERARKCYQSQERSTPESDAKLLCRLAGDKPLHGTTMRGTVMSFDIVAPQFVVRQLTRHIVGHDSDGNDIWHTGHVSFDEGGSYDEQSLRYTESIRYYVPTDLDGDGRDAYAFVLEDQLAQYRKLRSMGVTKQRARVALGPSFYSQYETTMNLQGLLDFYHKRMPGGGAQAESIAYAVAILELAEEYVAPGAVAAWKEKYGVV